MNTRIEAPAPVADNIWRPAYVESRKAHVCQRVIVGRDGVARETYGARLSGPEGERFSPLFLFRREDAQSKCDELNANG